MLRSGSQGGMAAPGNTSSQCAPFRLCEFWLFKLRRGRYQRLILNAVEIATESQSAQSKWKGGRFSDALSSLGRKQFFKALKRYNSLSAASVISVPLWLTAVFRFMRP